MDISEIADCCNGEINLIAEKLNHSKSKKNILKWLENFGEQDWLYALQILDNINYLSESDLYIACDEMINRLIENSSADLHYYFNPVAKYGKSATLLTYYMEKSKAFKKLIESGRATYLITEMDIKSVYYNDKTVLVFFDDFFGTGGSFNKHFEQFQIISNESIKNVTKVYGACIYYMEKAKQNILKYFPTVNIIGNVHHKIFGDDPSFFDTSFITNKFKAIAHDYANKHSLFKGRFSKHNLGYKQSEAFLSFAYSPPNNTLPIIWSGKSNWYPLLPREFDDVLAANKEFREQIAVSATKVFLNMPITTELEHGVSKKKFIVFGLIRLLKSKFAIPIIATKLGLSVKLIDEYLEIAKQLNLIDEHNQLTNNGNEKLSFLNEDIVKRKQENKKTFNFEEINYLPKKFSG